ncbi:MAG: hypothetical protein A2Y15_00120 [Clostridiales bacterium GWF2_36_10]|nr:MAG: hypothetical protein A2Y15_00120 [Clostridiales bacterium GWF2_36_10]HAN20256.1 hypothetical protein [Clostridiales bacterium]
MAILAIAFFSYISNKCVNENLKIKRKNEENKENTVRNKKSLLNAIDKQKFAVIMIKRVNTKFYINKLY